MKKVKHALCLAVIFGSLTTTSAVLAAEVGGGTWNYGVGVTGSYSDYYHGSKTHSSTVQKGDSVDSHRVGSGSWAKSRLTIYSGCSFYWNVY